ncbi:hypothetical protein K491DRAFT_590933 [Lophiostoma macrostomum CBS 122681]|uniref:MARVEL domain-containing protein n=1 Tax=Lophiostoma macrostomum CBS 122681 TaxID=1314788 RepID=A0A6A6THN5_9PLEO|nr:hypothetical protein K491DRAFT_590933 [Lophiostoma macrostomum CBS 122681]
MARTFLTPATAKPIIGASHLLTWVSSAIVVGITGYFLNNYAHGTHLIYEVTIAALTLAFWLPAIVLPFTKTYRNYFIPLNLIFSYLWLTAFIFAAQDYSYGAGCNADAPLGGSCSLKKTNYAFSFLAFFGTLTALIADTLLWRAAAVPARVFPEKEVRPSVETGAAAA